MKQPFPETIELDLDLDDTDDDAALRRRVARKLSVSIEDLPELILRRRSIDARKGRIRIHLTLELARADQVSHTLGEPTPREVRAEPRVIIVGYGPCGLFCAYELARAGIGSIVLDRGKPVQPRRVDLARLNREGIVDSDSNYCFGEGGAGTYSDGKLYSRADKRGNLRDVLELLALHGAPARILSDARPHIGSNKLPKVVQAIRERLENVGVEFRFGARVVDLLTKSEGVNRTVRGVRLANGEELFADHVVLATGHSARDIYTMLHNLNVSLVAKPFAVGVRIEHPQPLINRIQYGAAAGHPKLPAAAYRLAETIDERGVFSFCMCPGGWIVPAATSEGELVVNGMSLSRRDSPFANSGIVSSIDPSDLERAGYHGVFAGIELQKRLEHAAFVAGGGNFRAPATRITDFVNARGSSTAAHCSYKPGVIATNIGEVLDTGQIQLTEKLRAAIRAFDQKMRGYITDEAMLIGIESRTSSPIRIPRDPETLESPDLHGLYPCGEGAGYAGGIVSAAIDGINVAKRISALPNALNNSC